MQVKLRFSIYKNKVSTSLFFNVILGDNVGMQDPHYGESHVSTIFQNISGANGFGKKAEGYQNLQKLTAVADALTLRMNTVSGLTPFDVKSFLLKNAQEGRFSIPAATVKRFLTQRDDEIIGYDEFVATRSERKKNIEVKTPIIGRKVAGDRATPEVMMLSLLYNKVMIPEDLNMMFLDFLDDYSVPITAKESQDRTATQKAVLAIWQGSFESYRRFDFRAIVSNENTAMLSDFVQSENFQTYFSKLSQTEKGPIVQEHYDQAVSGAGKSNER